MQFNDTSSLPAYLASRRSARPRDLIAPGPDTAEITDIVAMASRTPDHGKLAPWRVVHVLPEQRSTFAERLVAAYLSERRDAGRLEIESMESFARQAPELLVVLFSPKESSKIPVWEQELSAGAFTMNLLHAIHARGFAAGWVTGWQSYNDDVRDLFGKAPERIAGFVFVGTPRASLEERPRPEIGNIYSQWTD